MDTDSLFKIKVCRVGKCVSIQFYDISEEFEKYRNANILYTGELFQFISCDMPELNLGGHRTQLYFPGRVVRKDNVPLHHIFPSVEKADTFSKNLLNELKLFKKDVSSKDSLLTVEIDVDYLVDILMTRGYL